MKKIIVVSLFFIAVLSIAYATTWGVVEKECPVCEKTSSYQSPMSYGSYIYQWPSKYQLLFWPVTANPSVYTCPDCNYSAFMWDFEALDSTMIPKIKEMLKDNKMGVEFEDYLDIATSKRLEQAEKVYKLLDRSDDFWCWFHRVKAYHYELEEEDEKSKEEREAAYEIAEKLSKIEDRKGEQKELFIIMASMKYYTGNREQAFELLEKAEKETYEVEENKNSASYDVYLSQLISDFREMDKKENK